MDTWYSDRAIYRERIDRHCYPPGTGWHERDRPHDHIHTVIGAAVVVGFKPCKFPALVVKSTVVSIIGQAVENKYTVSGTFG